NHIRVAAALALAALAGLAQAAPLPAAAPEDVGMSSERLARIDAAMQLAIDKGELPGAVVMIARAGKLAYAKSLGWQDKAAGVRMREHSISRLYSMTKPVTSVAVMMLVEEGRVGLHEPVSKYVPEFANMLVGREVTDASTGLPGLELTPAKRQITIQDLLRHTSGLTYGVLGQTSAI